jgi:hypothetical protein
MAVKPLWQAQMCNWLSKAMAVLFLLGLVLPVGANIPPNLISGKRFWQDGYAVAGQQFEYQFDDIGNRVSTKSGGDRFGANLRSTHYAVNNLNQTTSRTAPDYVNILGTANNAATVTVNHQSAERKSDYYRKELSVTNATGPVWLSVTNIAVLNQIQQHVGSPVPVNLTRP